MKRSRHIHVAALSILGLAACSTRQAALPDPCKPETYNDVACQDAVKNHGYYSNGSFVHAGYTEPYLSYYQRYQTYTAEGGVTHAASVGAYAAHGQAEGSVSRGGFGESAHGGAGE